MLDVGCFVFHSTFDVCAVSCSVRLGTCVLFRITLDFVHVCCFVFCSNGEAGVHSLEGKS